MILKRLEDYLNTNKVYYTAYYHYPAYSAKECAKYLQVPSKNFVKTVVVKTEDGYVMAVLPACRKINFDSFKKATHKDIVDLASEDEFKKLFPDCEIGAMPPFGNLYKIPVYAASALKDDYEIVFNAGTHTDSIKMRFVDYKRLVKPKFARFSEPVHNEFSQ